MSTEIDTINNRKIKVIEQVIDDHLCVLHGEQALEDLKVMTYKQKLEYLRSFEVTIKKDKKAKRLRLQEMTKSYNSFDSVQFKKIKQVQELYKEDADFKLESAHH